MLLVEPIAYCVSSPGMEHALEQHKNNALTLNLPIDRCGPRSRRKKSRGSIIKIPEGGALGANCGEVRF
jgi:hypothetical protein